MKFTGKLKSLVKTWQDNQWTVSFSVAEEEALEALSELDGHELNIEAKKKVNHRSLDANRLLWECLTQIARETHQDKWDVYLSKLKAHGKCYPVTVVKAGVDALKAAWRESEIVGEWVDCGVEKVTVLCYPGSHLYDSKEFSILLNDVTEDMKDLGLQPPSSEEMRRSLEQWEKSHQ